MSSYHIFMIYIEVLWQTMFLRPDIRRETLTFNEQKMKNKNREMSTKREIAEHKYLTEYLWYKYQTYLAWEVGSKEHQGSDQARLGWRNAYFSEISGRRTSSAALCPFSKRHEQERDKTGRGREMLSLEEEEMEPFYYVESLQRGRCRGECVVSS
jgi:hypothetical protein